LDNEAQYLLWVLCLAKSKMYDS